ncbi:prolyl oligopeptidase family serine peptidase [Sphingobacterium sp. DK4209]|uniref:Prolyl oligopeptidase family serine peptidase n=1 Tax=Sphingobacterium zhuxiongii TaxID=2662364 RepID=A0A5Q0QFK1_9SPHI|nr:MULTISPECIES: alpha/beta hydrolase [unclassified Sphingobacterium]MVZ65638.1 prolyl oligopeptidase family serine peptidase [Sphingobacterium sp. DK4209]QGA27761.1 prolyl oligopeptidase family serine peptidase [Sphingobacterium sp. dk4302]
MKNLFIVLSVMLSSAAFAQDQGEVRPLYSGEMIPGATKPTKELTGKEIPKLYAHPAKQNNKDLVFLVIPGGGYANVAMNHEGHDVANRLNDLGYNAYVLEYRLPKVETMKDKRFGPLQDAQYALRTASIENPGKKVVVLGFSAGGHLAGSLSNLYDRPQTDELKDTNLRPSFSVLCYPVISMDDAITHKGSKNNLIGPNLTEEDVELFSLEKQVDQRTPPTFLMSAKDDKGVPIENSYRYQAALNKNKVENTLFTYEEGGHGFGMVNKTDSRDWFDAMIKWIENVNAKLN